MSYGLINKNILTNIADAIRSKLGVTTKYKPSQMASAIESISGGGGTTPTGTKQISITSNGITTEDVTSYANAEVVVNVPTGITPTGTKQVSVTQNGTVTEDVTNYASVEVNTNVVNPDYTAALTALGVQSDLTDGIEALTAYSNGVTGESDTTLSDAVHTLADGYGHGGETDYDDVTLPSEYQRVEYIESSETQFIMLPFGFSPSDEIHTKMAIDTSMPSDKFVVCPQTWNNDNNRFGIIGVNNNQKNLGVAYGNIPTNTSLMVTQITNDGLLHKYSYKNKIFWSDDLAITFGTSKATFGADTANLKLFYGYNANTKGKIAYYVHKKANDTGVALYACYRKADGVIGLYDVANDVFYTNDGTGTFTKGADI